MLPLLIPGTHPALLLLQLLKRWLFKQLYLAQTALLCSPCCTLHSSIRYCLLAAACIHNSTRCRPMVLLLLLLLLLYCLLLQPLRQLLTSCSCTFARTFRLPQQLPLLLALPHQTPVRLRLALRCCPLLCQQPLGLQLTHLCFPACHQLHQGPATALAGCLVVTVNAVNCQRCCRAGLICYICISSIRARTICSNL
jgi:hypothetical protein